MALHRMDRKDEDDLRLGKTPETVGRAEQRETLVLHTPTAAITERRALSNASHDYDRYDDGPGVGPSSAAMATSRTVVRDVVAERHRRISQINQVLWFIVGSMEVLLTLRLVMKLLGANPAAGFTQAVYNFSAPLMAPFIEIFPASVFGSLEFEPATAVAMLVWFLLGIGISRLVWILNGEPREVK